MFSRKFRLPAEEFKKAGKRKLPIPHFFVLFGKNSLGFNRFGVVIGVKFDKSAAKRHYWKRQIREVLKKWPSLGADVIVSPLPDAKKFSAREMASTLAEAYKKIN